MICKRCGQPIDQQGDIVNQLCFWCDDAEQLNRLEASMEINSYLRAKGELEYDGNRCEE